MLRWAHMKARGSVYSFSRAPTGRAQCRVCKRLVGKGEVRLVTFACVSAWPMPRRSTSFVRHVECVTPGFANAVLKVHGVAENVPVVGSLSAGEVVRAREVLTVVGHKRSLKLKSISPSNGSHLPNLSDK